MTPRFAHPPAALRRRGVRLENIALVPASLLPFKTRYQALARRLPQGTVLLVLPRRASRQRQRFVQLASRFASHGYPIATRSIEEVRHR